MNRADEMRELFARWKRTDQSLTVFAKAEGVAYAKLLYWRKKLGGDARRKASPARTTAPSKLVPVRIVPDSLPTDTSPDKFEVWFSDGTSLDVPRGFDEHELRRIVDVLRAC